jgi:hypothetical protein
MSDTALQIVTWAALAAGIVVLLLFFFGRRD